MLHLYKSGQKFAKEEIFDNLKSQYPWVPDEKFEERLKEGIEESKKMGRKKKNK
jgi:hypothetical protein